MGPPVRLARNSRQAPVVIRVAVAQDHRVDLVDIMFQSFQVVEQGQGALAASIRRASQLALPG